MSSPYWTLDTSLFEGIFRYFGREPVLVWAKGHTEVERYGRSGINQEITPIAITQGGRTYLHMRPFVASNWLESYVLRRLTVARSSTAGQMWKHILSSNAEMVR